MLQTRLSNQRDIEPSGSEFLSLQHTVSSALALISRQYPILVFAVVLCLGLASAYLLTTPKRFASTAELIIDSRRMQGLQQQQSLGGNDAPLNSAMVDSQVEILKSETVALAVIKDLRLTEDPEFINPEGGLIANIVGSAAHLFGNSPRSDYGTLRTAIGRLIGNLSVKRLGMSYVIEISFQSQSPQRAAQIANAVAEAYIVDFWSPSIRPLDGQRCGFKTA